MKNSDSNKFGFLEPNGHLSPETKIERYWKNISGPYSLTRRRTIQYSAYSGMVYSPLRYLSDKFSLTHEYPSTEWIKSTFTSFVRNEMTILEHSEFPAEIFPEVSGTISISDHSINRFLLYSETVEAYQRPSITSQSTSEDIACSVYNLLCDPKLGAKANRQNNDLNEFIKRVVPTIKEKSRLLFVCPGFPFKDQNRFRVPFGADQPDMAEICFLKRLYNLVTALYQIHSYGADVVILSDGALYGDIFGIEESDAKKYLERLIYYRNKINVQGTVSIICLKEMIDRSSEDGWSWELVRFFEENIRSFAKTHDSDIDKVIKLLKKGMKWNANSKRTNKMFEDVDDRECWDMLLADNVQSISPKLKEKWIEFDQIAYEASVRYAAVNLMLKYTDLIKLFFPDAIRATIHPKKDQFSFAGDSRSFAWNGVAWSKEWPKSIYDIKTEKIMDLRGKKIKQVVFEHSGLPCFFTMGAQYKNIEKATGVLPAYGWFVSECSIEGREFVGSDLEEYLQLSRNDENFSWERKMHSDEYYESLLQFRINHYKKYGFGVHGIWIDNVLIGQCGLQVVSEDADEVEFVIFLGKSYTGKGYGSALTKYMVSKCKEEGMDKLLGIVRADNEDGKRLMEKFGGKTQGTLKHYNHDGIIYKLI